MKPTTLRALAGSAWLSLAAQLPSSAASGHGHGHAHRHLHQHHSLNHTHGGSDLELVKPRKLVNRAGQCPFPEGEGLVAVTPGSLNAGWALSPDQECTAGSYCPYACPSGKLMNQWKPGTTYTYPESMDGGLYCDHSGSMSKPFPDEDYCVEGVGTVSAVNNCGKVVAVCQTVLPGNEAMLIPTSVDSSATIAVPGTSYWDATAAHFYVNPPGYTTDEACIWGTSAEPIGNWSPYVIGANQDSTGNTYVKLGWNPIYTDSFGGVKPTFGMKIECDGNCNGLPCSIDPSTDGFGGVNSDESATGAGGADYCVVTVTSGSASIVFFNTDGSSGDSSSGSSSGSSSDSSSDPETTKSPPATTKEPEPATTSALLIKGLHAVDTSTSSAEPTTTEVPTTTHSSTTSSTTSHLATTTSVATSLAPSSSYYKASHSASSSTVQGGIFQESESNSTAKQSTDDTATVTSSADLTDATAADSTPAPTSSKSSGSNPDQGQAAFAGLVVAIVAAACLY